MPFPIEILTTDSSLAPAIHRALDPLKRVQTEFRYEIPVDRLLQKAYLYKTEAYTSEGIAEWLEAYRAEAGGHRPFIILIISGTLNGNHYGGRTIDSGFAFFTVSGHHQFVNDLVRYCRYYIVRYTLSFVAPTIMSHPSVPEGCMFDNKNYKPDILKSLNNGRICDNCRGQLLPHLNEEIGPSLQSLTMVVTNQHPYSLVLKGGGVKGLALVGALIELGKYYSFNAFAGTSAGAIAAILLGAGYTPTELKKILSDLDFMEFKDSRSWLEMIISVVRKSGLHSGNYFLDWMEEMLKTKLSQKEGIIQMRDLDQRAIVYASRRDGVVKFDKSADRKEASAAFAARASMSIPGFFAPVQIDGYKTYDGGLGNNFPLRLFLEDNQHDLFIGLYLKSPLKRRAPIPDDLYSIVTDADERTVVDQHRNKIVVIDPAPIKTTQFDLSDADKEYLLLAGKVGALEYLLKYNPESGVTSEELEKAKVAMEEQRAKLVS